MSQVLWTAEDLIEATGGVASRDFAATGVSIDTRSLQPGDLFVALRGENGDGHAYVGAALAAGAAGALVAEMPGGLAADAPLLRVDDTLAGLARLGGYGRARFTGRLVAVTGSVGKTTTKEMLRRILSAAGPTHAATASYNNHWGLPLTLARLPATARFCVAEIGMSNPGEILPLARLAAPHVAIITAIAPAHIGRFADLAAIAREKSTIFGGLEQGGVAILPSAAPHAALLTRAALDAGAGRIIGFGEAEQDEVRLLGLDQDAEGATLRCLIAGQAVELRLAAPGRHMAMNALAALAGAHALGLGAEEAAAALAGFAALGGRGARTALALPGGTALLLDESYNANPASMRAALAVLGLQPGRRVAVLGDMLELGESGPAAHRDLAEAVLEHADLVFTAGPMMEGLAAALPPARLGAHAETAQALAPLVAAALAPGDAVLVKGSLGSRMRAVVDALRADGT
ncbi:MAG: UDP-N-acetylmuramoyl-tripeptide--D-alanyl-D-alanine ligase [Rhodospirillales bacterium]|nr:UDP-N-acetylmuramoyl-tripeptide--D-alanyl-D-alanine ligase [Rhodospirillales bacterium]